MKCFQLLELKSKNIFVHYSFWYVEKFHKCSEDLHKIFEYKNILKQYFCKIS